MSEADEKIGAVAAVARAKLARTDTRRGIITGAFFKRALLRRNVCDETKPAADSDMVLNHTAVTVSEDQADQHKKLCSWIHNKSQHHHINFCPRLL